MTAISKIHRKTLRPHQSEAIDLIRQSFGKGNKTVVCQGPTGFGKTLVAANIISSSLAKGKSVLFTVPMLNLVDQTIEAFEAEGIFDIGVIQADHPRTNPLARVQIASVQTLARREVSKFDLVIVDECHGRFAVLEKLMQTWTDTFWIGLSATPWQKGMGLLWQDLVIPTTIGDLIENEYLSKFVAFAPDVPDMSSVKTVAGDYQAEETAEVMKGNALMANVVQTWLAKADNRPTLVFGVNRAHAAALKAQFEGAGIAAAYCDSYTDTVERKRIKNQFSAGEIKVACSVRTLTTGVDWPVSCIVDAAPTKSEILHVQKIGRGLRVNPGTEDLLILDHAGNSLRLGLVTDIHHSKLDTTEKGPAKNKASAVKLPKECSKCSTLFSGLVCPACGHERKPIAGVETVEGELLEIAGKQKYTKAEKQRFYSGLVAIATQRGRAKGWVGHTFRDKFGTWPRGLEWFPDGPDTDVSNFVRAKAIAFAKKKGFSNAPNQNY